MKAKRPSGTVNTTHALAQHLGLSRWTVSRALNGHPGVREETARRVKAAMEQLGFRPNALARGLRGVKTRVVGVCFQTFGTPVFSKKLIALQAALRKRGYSAIIELIDEDAEAEREVISHFASLQVEGMIFVGGPLAGNLEFVDDMRVASSVPSVLIDPIEKSELPQIRLDRGYAMDVSMRKLRELGHRKIVIMGIRDDVIYGPERLSALKSVCAELEMEWGSEAIFLSDEKGRGMDYETGFRLGRRFIEENTGATGILAINDQVAIGAIRALESLGSRIPEEVSVVGFDNLDCSQYLHPSLASVDQRIDVVNDRAVSKLLDEIEDGEMTAALSESVKPEFVMGESLGPAPRE